MCYSSQQILKFVLLRNASRTNIPHIEPCIILLNLIIIGRTRHLLIYHKKDHLDQGLPPPCPSQ